MNAVNALMRDQQAAEFEAALEAANEWLNLARPIIRATFKLDDLEYEITHGSSFNRANHHDRTLGEAREYVNEARNRLCEMLEGIRDDYIADQRRSFLSSATEPEIEAADDFNDMLDAETLTVAMAIRIVEAEWNAE